MRVVGNQHFRILGSGSYLPKHVVSAEEMDRRCNKPPGWCREHIGVETRHECLKPESMVSMGCRAILSAIDEAKLSWDEVDFIIDCSTSIYRPIPCNAAHFQHCLQDQYQIDVRGIPCIDIHSTCLSSLVAMNMSNGLFATGDYRNIVLVSSESGLAGVNLSEPQSACLIGDGAAAIVLSCAPDYGTLGYAHETYAEHIDSCCVEGGGHKQPVFQYTAEKADEYRFTMDGPTVFRIAMQRLKPMVEALMDQWSPVTGLGIQDVHALPHQASPRALRAVQKIFGASDERFHTAVQEVGNMVAASLPYMMDRVRKSDVLSADAVVLALGTSAGYSQAAMLFRF